MRVRNESRQVNRFRHLCSPKSIRRLSHGEIEGFHKFWAHLGPSCRQTIKIRQAPFRPCRTTYGMKSLLGSFGLFEILCSTRRLPSETPSTKNLINSRGLLRPNLDGCAGSAWYVVSDCEVYFWPNSPYVRHYITSFLNHGFGTQDNFHVIHRKVMHRWWSIDTSRHLLAFETQGAFSDRWLLTVQGTSN